MSTHGKILDLLDDYYGEGVDQGVEEMIMSIAEGLGDYNAKSNVDIKGLMNKWIDHYTLKAKEKRK